MTDREDYVQLLAAAISRIPHEVPAQKVMTAAVSLADEAIEIVKAKYDKLVPVDGRKVRFAEKVERNGYGRD